MLKIGLLATKFAIFAINSPILKLKDHFIKTGISGKTFTNVLKLMKTPIPGLEKAFFALKNRIRSVAGSIFRFVTSGTVLQTVFGKLRGVAVGAFNMLKGSALGVIGIFGRFKNFVFGAAHSIFRFATSGNVIRTVFNVALNVIKQVRLALLRTPWGVVAAVAIGAALAIYKYWDQIKAFFTGFWQGLKQGIEPFTTAIGNLVQSTPLLGAAWDVVSGAISTVFEWFKNLLKPVNATKEQIDKATSAGESFGKLVGGAINLVLTPLKAVVNLFGWIFNNVGKLGSIGDTVKNFFSGPSSAKESNNNKPLPPPPKSIAAPPPIRSGQGKTTPQQTNHNSFSFTVNAAPGQSPQQIAQEVMRIQKQAQGVQQRSLMVDWGYSQ